MSSSPPFWLLQFCQEHPPDDDWSHLPTTTQAFLQTLDLPTRHPLCTSEWNNFIWNDASLADYYYNDDGDNDETTTTGQWLVLLWATQLKPFLALCELWLRLVAGYVVAPLAGLLVVLKCQQKQQQQRQRRPCSISSILWWLMAAAASWILMTDSNYVYEYGGPQYGMGCCAVALWYYYQQCYDYYYYYYCCNRMSVGRGSQGSEQQCDDKKQVSKKKMGPFSLLLESWSRRGALSSTVIQPRVLGRLVFWILLLATLTGVLRIRDDNTLHFQFGAPYDVDIQFQPGIYYFRNHSSSVVSRAMSRLGSSQLAYDDDDHRATPWILTGDARTGLPYLWNRPPPPLPEYYYTVYLANGNDDDDDNYTDAKGKIPEVLAVKLAFPTTAGGYNASAPLYLVLHGMNGGATDDNDGYIVDFVARRTAAGSTVALLLSRGMHTPLTSGEIFSVARTSDVHAVAQALRRAHAAGPLAGVGFSIGAIVLNHYVVDGQYYDCGTKFPLDAAFSISGALDARPEADFLRPQRLWQPMIADYYRSHQYTPSERPEWLLHKPVMNNDHRPPPLTQAHALHQRLSQQQQRQQLYHATNVVQLDEASVVPFYNYSGGAHEYYAHQSALGDVSVEDWLSPTQPAHVRHDSQLARNLRIPLGVLHALDDPISTWHTVVGNTGWMRPDQLVQLNENLVLILTARGGHVGWPLSWRPWRYGWAFMNDAASNFVEAVWAVQQEMKPTTTN